MAWLHGVVAAGKDTYLVTLLVALKNNEKCDPGIPLFSHVPSTACVHIRPTRQPFAACIGDWKDFTNQNH